MRETLSYPRTILYECLLGVVAILTFPYFLYLFLRKKKYRESFSSRWGNQVWPKKQANPDFGVASVWVHAVSVGEARAVAPLVHLIKEHYPSLPLFITSVTETGYAEVGRACPQADGHFYLPFDWSFLMRPMIEAVSPGIVILSETDFWWNFLRLSRQRGAFIALVSGKISEKARRRFDVFSFFSRPLFSLIDCFCVQNTLYKNRFQSMGIPSQKIAVTGNMKFDDSTVPLSFTALQEFKTRLGIKDGDLILTIGSTHAPEEKLLFPILAALWKEVPQLKVLLVPRHPERFNEVKQLLEEQKIKWSAWSSITPVNGEEQLILIDAMGLLRSCYQASSLAVVAGSYTAHVGGHNVLEPCFYGTPLLFGPFMHSQEELARLVIEAGAGYQVSLEFLGERLLALLQNVALRDTLKMKGLQLIESLKGSSKRTFIALKPILDEIQRKNENLIASKSRDSL